MTELPATLRAPTVHRVPRGLERRYARARALALQWMCDACDAQLPEACQVAYARLAWALPWLLLHDHRDPRVAEEARGSHKDREGEGIKAHILHRLVLFETGDWCQLIRAALPFADGHPRVARATPAAPAASSGSADAPLDPCVLARVCERALDGSLRAAVRLLQGSQPLPPTEDTVQQVLSLYPHEGPTAALPPLGSRATIQPRYLPRDVGAKLRSLRATAAPGPGGERNSHIKLLSMSPQGHATLARWCSLWPSGRLPGAVRQVFLQCLVVPLDKGGGKARPIVLQEGLLKVLTGLAVTKSQRLVETAVHPTQYGASGLAGAARMTWAVRAAMATSPHLAFVGTDMRNAFGTMHRSYAYAAAAAAAPAFAACLRSLWEGASPTMLLEGPSGYRPYCITDALCQGGCDAAPAFCLGIARFLRHVSAACAARGCPVQAWAYVDDIVLAAAPEHVPMIMQEFDREAATAGLQRRPDKCSSLPTAA